MSLCLRDQGGSAYGCDMVHGCDTCERTYMMQAYKYSGTYSSLEVRSIDSLCQCIIKNSTVTNAPYLVKELNHIQNCMDVTLYVNGHLQTEIKVS
jgi:hypothetical protein